MNFVSKRHFFCLLWWEMFTTDTIVYPCEQNQNRYENGLAPVNTGKGPVKLIKRVKIAYSFLRSVSNQFHVIILSLPM